MVLQRGVLCPLSYTSEVDRLPTEVHCIRGDYLFISVSESIQDFQQIITIVGNFQHTDHYFFGHNNRKKVIVGLVQCWVLRCESVSQFCMPRMLISERNLVWTINPLTNRLLFSVTGFNKITCSL